MSTSVRLILPLTLLLTLGACVSSGSGGATASGGSEDTGPTKLKLDPEEIPAAVRAIETQIDRRTLLVADEVVIDVSRNYEWDVSLSGKGVEKQQKLPDGGMMSVAEGSPRAMVRNMEIRGYQKITFRKSGFGVRPYIRITAKGNAAHAEVLPDGGVRVLGRDEIIRIDDARVLYGREILTEALQPGN